MGPVDELRSNRLQMWLGVLAVFVVGLLIGALAGIIYGRHESRMSIERFRMHPAVRAVRAITGRLERELGLSAKQVAAIRPLVEVAFQKARVLHQRVRRDMFWNLEKMLAKIRHHLTPAQNRKLDRPLVHRIFSPHPEEPPQPPPLPPPGDRSGPGPARPRPWGPGPPPPGPPPPGPPPGGPPPG